MADNDAPEKFKDFKRKFGQIFDSHKFKWLRFCLFNILCYSDLITATSGHQLLNSLEEFGFIAHDNVHLLLDIAKLSCLKKAEDLVTEYILDGGANKNAENKEKGKLSNYRKSLFNALRDVGPDELSGIKDYYELTDDFPTTWDLVLRLERDGILEEGSEKKNKFANCLNKKAKNHLLNNSVALAITLKQKAEDSEDQSLPKRHERMKVEISGVCFDKLNEIEPYFYVLCRGCSKALEITEGSIVFHVSLVDPRALTNIWNLHQSGQLLKDIAGIMFTEKHWQEFEQTWETQFDHQTYIEALNKLNGEGLNVNTTVTTATTSQTLVSESEKSERRSQYKDEIEEIQETIEVYDEIEKTEIQVFAVERQSLDLQDVDFHANWKLENTSKSFKSLKQSIAEHREDKESFTIEALLFESYLYMSDFKGNDEKDIATAKQKNEEAFCAITNLNTSESIKDGYKSMYLALKCWFTTKQREKEEIYKKLKYLLTAYKDASEEDKQRFQASVNATKGFALSRLSFSRYEESESELNLATQTCPENVEWKFMLGLITWRRYTIYKFGFEWSDKMNRAEEIMTDVLQLDADHAYAKTVLADIYRRKYEQEFIQNTSSNQDVDHSLVFANVNDPRIIKIMNLLSEAKEKASMPRLLSLIAQCYIRMGECRCRRVKRNMKCSEPKYDSIYIKEAQNVIEYSKRNYREAACIFVQEAVLYRKKNNPNRQLECLENAIRLQPSDPADKMQKANALASFGKIEDSSAVYDNLLSDFKDDPFVMFHVNQNYASYLISVRQYDEALFRKQECLNIALQSFVKNTSGNGFIEFIDEQQSSVDKIITFLRRSFNITISHSRGRHKVAPNLENAKLHEKIGDFKNACSYYRGALRAFHYENTPNTNHDQEVDTLFKFAKVNLKMGNHDVCSNILAIIKCETCVTEKDHVRQLTVDLFVAKGEKAAESGDHLTAIRMFTRSTEMGSLVCAKRLLEETKKIKDNTLGISALESIASVAKDDENWRKEINLKQELEELLPSCDDVSLIGQELKTLRECQLEMEYSILMDDDNIATNISTVLQKGRNVLNHAMEYFENTHYPNYKGGPRDFIVIPMGTPTKNVGQRIKNMLWRDFSIKFNLLFSYLISIQPATNEKFKWLQDLVYFNNQDRYQRSLENSSKTISVARDMCSNIEEILEEIYKWCLVTGA